MILRYLLKLKLIICLISLHAFLYFYTMYKYDNQNFVASKIRDDEEYRFAYVFTLFNAWRNNRMLLPFSYAKYPDTNHNSYPKITNVPGIIIGILSSDRIRNKIDYYQPHYLLESVVNLIKAIILDKSKYGLRFPNIQIMVCPAADNINRFTDLSHVITLLGSNNICYRPKPIDHLSFTCRSVLDTSNCLLDASLRVNSSDFVLLIEDDMISNELIMTQLWDIMYRLNEHSVLKFNLSLINMHRPVSKIQYSISDLGSVMELLFLSSVLTCFCFIIYLRCYLRSFKLFFSVILFFYVFILTLLTLTLIGRFNLLLFWHKLFHYQSLDLILNSDHLLLGSASLFPAKQSRNLAKYLNTVPCKLEGFVDNNIEVLSKSQLISSFLTSQRYSIWTTFPNLFRHRGLYSSFSNKIRNPMDVE